jgi:hypothetical protein
MKIMLVYALMVTFSLGAVFAQEGEGNSISGHDIIELDPAIFDEYVGVYYWPPHKTLITVTKEDDKLFGQPEGKVKSQLLPWDIDQFVIDGVGAELSFIRNDEGRVVSILLNQDSEQNLAERVSGERLAQIRKDKEHERAHRGHNHDHEKEKKEKQ